MTEASTILRGAVQTNRANRQIKFIVGGIVILLLIVYLISNAIATSGAYYRSVSEVVAQQEFLAGKNLRVSGDVVPGSITYNAAALDLNFKIADPKDASKLLAIRFHGVKPDQIDREGSSAIVEGSLRGDGVVEANSLMLKCPSRYEEYEEIKVQAVK
ncbi:MAG: cytochrome c maturation protein CcmE [Chloroflexi bacterium]|nr:cytochrome c maturation protein CcmE [Chloroflexota bacterium]